ncbi:hypothetical protein L227DRAFT_145082 [Lentinus tigrinus ALCF2SS1-6]|uniref:Uncharacterized protein n=1 Tax=Lentinus tigrinus ALCF2SS1-6 TaxID=1328759 RepID=A0A5C2STJ3_9APHY|nr:hypothetical protein L227DRAFT_145082 [Lentinus tigrinus ALCF2SS1-6]
MHETGHERLYLPRMYSCVLAPALRKPSACVGPIILTTSDEALPVECLVIYRPVPHARSVRTCVRDSLIKFMTSCLAGPSQPEAVASHSGGGESWLVLKSANAIRTCTETELGQRRRVRRTGFLRRLPPTMDRGRVNMRSHDLCSTASMSTTDLPRRLSATSARVFAGYFGCST